MSAPLDVKRAWLSREFKHGRQLYRGQFSPDGRTIAAGGQDKLVHVWDVESEAKQAFSGHATWLSALEFHPREKLLYTADYHGAIHCRDYGGAGKLRWNIEQADANTVRAITVTPDGRHLLSTGDDGMVKVWNTADGKPVTELTGHRECVFSLALSPDGSHLVSGDLYGSIRQWSTENWKAVRELDAKVLHTRKDNFIADVGGVRSLAFSPDGKLLAAGGMKDAKSNAFCPGKPTVLVFDWDSGAVKSELGIKGKSDGPFNALRFLEDGSLAGHTELLHTPSELVFWKTDQADPVHSITNDSAYDLSLHPDGRQLLAACYVSGGSSGNGSKSRNRKQEEYLPNRAVLRVFSLFAKPEDAKPE